MVGYYAKHPFHGLLKINDESTQYYSCKLNGINIAVLKSKCIIIPPGLLKTEIGQLIWHTPA